MWTAPQVGPTAGSTEGPQCMHTLLSDLGAFFFYYVVFLIWSSTENFIRAPTHPPTNHHHHPNNLLISTRAQDTPMLCSWQCEDCCASGQQPPCLCPSGHHHDDDDPVSQWPSPQALRLQSSPSWPRSKPTLPWECPGCACDAAGCYYCYCYCCRCPDPALVRALLPRGSHRRRRRRRHPHPLPTLVGWAGTSRLLLDVEAGCLLAAHRGCWALPLHRRPRRLVPPAPA